MAGSRLDNVQNDGSTHPWPSTDTLVPIGRSGLCEWHRISVTQPPTNAAKNYTTSQDISTKTWLNVSKDKTKVMRINKTVDDGIVLNGNFLENVESLTYLRSVRWQKVEVQIKTLRQELAKQGRRFRYPETSLAVQSNLTVHQTPYVQ